MNSILAALITGLLAMAGSIITAVSASKLTAYKIDELKQDFADLRERVNKHNNLVERVAIAEQSIKTAHKRIDTLGAARDSATRDTANRD